MVLNKIYFNSLTKTVLVITYTLVVNFSNAIERQIDLLEAIRKISPYKSIKITENVSLLEGSRNLEKITNKLPLNCQKEITYDPYQGSYDYKYKDYLSLITRLVIEANAQKLFFDWEKINVMPAYQIVKVQKKINLNGNGNDTYQTFDNLLKNNLDSNSWWITNNLCSYNLEGQYSFANLLSNQYSLSISINPVIIYGSSNIYSNTIIVLYFVMSNQDSNDKTFYLKEATITIPSLLNNTTLWKKIKKNNPKIYEIRNSLKTCLSIEFNQK